MEKEITILYVDDEDINLFLFKNAFQSKYQVFTAAMPEDGLKILEDHNGIIVVISDMRMPQMNGIEFIRKAKQKHNDIAYFILTGFSYNDEIEQALEENVIQKFFTKPFDMGQIESSISRAIEELNLLK